MRQIRVVAAAARAQFQMTRSDIEDLFPMLTIPFFALIFLAIVRQANRPDLLPYSVVAPTLLALWVMALYIAAELINRDRWLALLEPLVATPAAFPQVMFGRVAVVSGIATIAFGESWLVAWVIFGVRVPIHHPVELAATVISAALAAAGTALVMAAFFALARTARTIQNALTYPFYLLGGVMVPTSYLPWWLQPITKVVYLSWAADLLRDCLHPASIPFFAPRLAMVMLLAVAGLAVGSVLLGRMIDHLRREGTLGLA